MDVTSAKYCRGSLEVVSGDSELLIKGLNIELELRPKAIVINGSIGRVEEHLDEISGKTKYVYIELLESIKVFENSGELLRNSIVGAFSLSTIERPYGCFLTITTSGAHAYNYVIVSPNMIAVVMSSKRAVYIEHSNNLAAIYIA
ncbi:MAG: hypothetical protein N3E36_01755 [Sulfolobales archaeon]|nr:hypothetical protein [Sulfolobales archaeon]MCX8198739.1 hypothetical protein [Sulfolobales archaeon]MDW8169812.1 hypothetical protein [Desulfurococcaceae archaeon]